MESRIWGGQGDPLGLPSYLRSRIKEFFGPEHYSSVLEDFPRSLLNEPALLTEPSFYINPEVEFAFPELEQQRRLQQQPLQGHKRIPGGVEIIQGAAPTPSRPPRRSFAVDVSETPENYVLRADLAGMTKENVKIQVITENNSVLVEAIPPKESFFGVYQKPQVLQESEESKQAEIKKELAATLPPEQVMEQAIPPQQQQLHETRAQPAEFCHLMERNTFNTMSRIIKLPQNVNLDKIEAKMINGLLVVVLGKRAEVKLEKRNIEIA